MADPERHPPGLLALQMRPTASSTLRFPSATLSGFNMHVRQSMTIPTANNAQSVQVVQKDTLHHMCMDNAQAMPSRQVSALTLREKTLWP